MTLTQIDIDLLISQCDKLKKQNENLQAELLDAKRKIKELEEEMRS